MTLTLALSAAGVLCAGALAAFLLRRSERAALAVGTAAAVAGCALGAAASILNLVGGPLSGDGSLVLPWSVPIGSLALGVDALSSFFLLCLFLVGGLASIYGAGYLKRYLGQGRLGTATALFDLLLASIALIVLARDWVLFLFAWEVMSVASYFLVVFEDEKDEVRRAGMTYLIASHVGLVFLMVFVGLASTGAGSTSFSAILSSGAPAAAGTAFLFALAGFGTKAGFWPVHIWLPDAYPAAPSHVSSVMSGVMSKIGIYGLLRALQQLGEPPAWWGGALVAVGVISGIAGILNALAQRDLKRMLAYSSVENLGLVALGLGLGLLGRAHGHHDVAFLGFAGALLHILNHGLMKGLLFQGAGAVLQGAGTRHLDSLGGLLKRMPAAGTAFLVGALAISGLPPLNGFVGEWLVYLSAFRGTTRLGSSAIFAVVAIAGLALIGGLAAAAFVRAFGVAFLGEPRTEAAQKAQDARGAMKGALAAGAALCAGIGLFPLAAMRLVQLPAGDLAGARHDFAVEAGPLLPITGVALGLLVLVGGLALLRKSLLRGREIREASTWGCGYAAPTARIQYTAASFADPVLGPFSPLLPRHAKVEGPEGFFPTRASADEQLGDMAGEHLLVPAARRLVAAMGRVRILQQGKLQLYLVYILVTLVALLAWQLSA